MVDEGSERDRRLRQRDEQRRSNNGKNPYQGSSVLAHSQQYQALPGSQCSHTCHVAGLLVRNHPVGASALAYNLHRASHVGANYQEVG